MADKSKIEWTDASWNPLRGVKGRWHCTKVSDGCKNCYAERMNRRFGKRIGYEVGADTFRLDRKILADPLKWRKPRMIFVCSMSDLFHEDVPFEWIAEIFTVMGQATQHTYQVLTKRPERLRQFYDWNYEGGRGESDWIETWPNVWLGVSVEDQAAADKRIPELLKTPAVVRFLSVEPMLGPVDLTGCINCYVPDKYKRNVRRIEHWHGPFQYSARPCGIHWVICGGESGPRARPMHPDWACSLRDQCSAAGVPFFFKQWGEWAPRPCGEPTKLPRYDGRTRLGYWVRDKFAEGGIASDLVNMKRIGKKAAGRLLDGREHMEFPDVDRKV